MWAERRPLPGRGAPAAACFLAASLAGLIPARAFNPDQSLDRTRTLRHAEPQVLEAFREAVLVDTGRMSFALPLPCAEVPVGAPGCARLTRELYEGPDGELGLSLLLAEEVRRIPGQAWATEAGGTVEGGKGSVGFRVDARAFAEGLSDGGFPSFDGEIVDDQDAGATGTVSYRSYARFRGHLYADTRLGRFRVAREAPHWGPGLRSNLAFNQASIPFNQITFHSRIGPFAVTTLYGDLLPGRGQEARTEKRIYAHRYEWQPARSLLLGVTEQLFLVDTDQPILFTPVFPLFVAKSFMHEHANNGNLAVDAAWRFGGRAMAYAEFLLDDLESPSSLLLKDYRQNKWAFMAGLAVAGRMGPMRTGLTAEYSRVEPWTYTHFADYPAQAAHLDAPLGNPNGPNSQSVLFEAHGRLGASLHLGLGAEWIWKGTDEGSGLFDPYLGGDHLRSKAFIAGVDPDFVLTPSAAWRWTFLAASMEAGIGESLRAAARIAVTY